MKMNRQLLIQYAKDERDRLIKKSGDAQRREDLRVEQEREAVEVAWRQFLENIQNRMADGELPTSKDVPAGLVGVSISDHALGRFKATTYGANTSDLDGFIGMMETVTDETVSLADIMRTGLGHVSRLFINRQHAS